MITTRDRLNPERLLNGGFVYNSSMVSTANQFIILALGATYKFGLGLRGRDL